MKNNKWPLRRLASLGVSLALIGVAFLFAGPREAISSLLEFPLKLVAIVSALFVTNLLIVTYRLYQVLAHFDLKVSAYRAWQASLAGQLAGQVFISLFGQVIGRHMVLRRNGISPVLIATITGYERTVQLLVSAMVCGAGAVLFLNGTFATSFFAQASLGEITFTALAAFAISLYVWRSKFEASLLVRISSAKNLKRSLSIAAISLVAQLLVLTTFVVGARFYLPDATLIELYSAAAIVSFAASLPITVNGWGLREIAAIYVFGQLGMSAADATAMSVLMGICVTTVGILLAPTAMKRGMRGAKVQPDAQVVTVKNADKIDMEKSAAWLLGTAERVRNFV